MRAHIKSGAVVLVVVELRRRTVGVLASCPRQVDDGPLSES